MRFLSFLLCLLALSPAALAQRNATFISAPSPADALVIAMKDANGPDTASAILGEAASANLVRAIAAADFAGEAGMTASLISGAETLHRRHWEDFGVSRRPMQCSAKQIV